MPLDRPLSAPEGWHDPPDNELARRALQFIKACPHTKGELASDGQTLGDTWLSWEENMTRHLFGTVDEGGRRRYETVYCEMPKKAGKAEHVDNKIPTPNGMRRMGGLEPGDYVFGRDGRPTQVVAATSVMHGLECMEVEFKSGETIVVAADHEWRVEQRKRVGRHNTRWSEEEDKALRKTYIEGGANAAEEVLVGRSRGAIYKRAQKLGLLRDGSHNRSTYKLDEPRDHSAPPIPDVVETREMYDNVRYDAGSSHAYRYAVEVPSALRTPESDVLIPPYLLGAWLGDENTDSAKITVADDEIIEQFRDEGVPVHALEDRGRATMYRLTPGDRSRATLQRDLREVGVLGDKHIPDEYLRGSLRQRLCLLRGLMDTDGTVDKKGYPLFSNTNRGLAEDVHELVCSLGMKATWNSRPAKIDGRTVGTAYRVRFYPPGDIRVFNVTRKADRQAQRERGSRADKRSIVDVRRVDSVPVRCIAVAAEDGVYLTGRSMIPTHNSSYTAAVMLYLLVADGEVGGELYSAAYKKDQAKVVWNIAREMVEAARWLQKRVEVKDYLNELRCPALNSVYKPITRKAVGQHGFNPSAVAFDELHTQPDRDLWSTIHDSMGARREPLLFAITNAGHDRQSICYEQRRYAMQVNDGDFEDDSFLGVIYGADPEGDDPWSEETWRKANPGLGVTVRMDWIEKKAEKARRIPSEQNAFKRWQLGQWTQAETRWLDPVRWSKAREEDFPSLSELEGRTCYGGLDIGSVKDLTSWVLGFPDPTDPEVIRFVGRHWCPEKRLYDDENPYRETYQAWARNGHLRTIKAAGGRVTDQRPIKGQIIEDAERFGLVDVALDRKFQGAQLSVELLEDEGIAIDGTGTGYRHMTAPCKELERRLYMEPPRIRHDGDPVLSWAASNVALEKRSEDQWKPAKDDPDAMIDPLVALLFSLRRAMRHEELAPRTSKYEEEGVVVL